MMKSPPAPTAIANAELTNLIAWAKGGNPLRQIADLYFTRKEYANALQYYREAQKVQRSYDYNTLLSRVGICLIHENKPDEALKIGRDLTSESGPRMG